MDWLKILLDLGVIALLGAGVVYAIRLEKQIRALRALHTEMAKYTAEFSRNIDRAEAGVKSLKQSARSAGDDLETMVKQATSLRDELSFVVEHADSLVNKITTLGSDLTARPASNGTDVAPAATVTPLRTPAAPEPTPRSRAERELLDALHAIQERQA